MPGIHEVSRNELAEIFSRYGHVLHAVILATSDNASRRRGFIVMSTHSEARLALGSLSRTEIKWVSSFFAR
jgi:RNA recognition motif-containing protein